MQDLETRKKARIARLKETLEYDLTDVERADKEVRINLMEAEAVAASKETPVVKAAKAAATWKPNGPGA